MSLLLIVTFLPALARWVWLAGALLVLASFTALLSWRGTRRRLARWRERRALRRDERAHCFRGTVRVVDGGWALRTQHGAASARSIALESDDGRLVLVDPSLGYVSLRLRQLRLGDRVAVLRRVVPFQPSAPSRRRLRMRGVM